MQQVSSNYSSTPQRPVGVGRLFTHPAVTRAGFWLLGASWTRCRPWYQAIDFGEGVTNAPWCPQRDKVQHRTESFLRFLDTCPIREDDVVVDIGSNAGLFSLLLSSRCRKVTGIEYDRKFHNQARFVQAQWKSRGLPLGDVRLIRGDVYEHLDVFADATVVLASKVLYHTLLGGNVHAVMEAIRRGSTRAIFVQGHTTWGGLGENDGIEDLLSKYGFEYKIAFDDSEYPIGLATRAGSKAV